MELKRLRPKLMAVRACLLQSHLYGIETINLKLGTRCCGYSNRTFMELKQRYLLPIPLKLLRSDSNRTFMELKLYGRKICKPFTVYSNRTFMELKQRIIRANTQPYTKNSNRTFMELKLCLRT